MKKLGRVLALSLVVAMLLALVTGCSPSVEEVVGTYVGTYEYEGESISVAVVIADDGRYAKAVVKRGEVTSSEVGDYEIKGNKIKLYDSSSAVYHGKYTVYKYKNGTIENNGHKLVKD